uniref:Uncharacterized protein n=1 Tax=Myoviridae sp. ctT3B27 TaxID=2826655 RepID=A0A8S5NBJ1_9CAUD|nr:MAG TPA: hypothetical protein [Myoviridae sp. ctT3B27]
MVSWVSCGGSGETNVKLMHSPWVGGGRGFDEAKSLSPPRASPCAGHVRSGFGGLSQLSVQLLNIFFNATAVIELQGAAQVVQCSNRLIVITKGISQRFMQPGTGLVWHIMRINQFQRLSQQRGTKGLPGGKCAHRRISKLFCNRCCRGAVVAGRQNPAMLQRMVANHQGTVIITGIDTPDHDVHDHVILPRTITSKDPGPPWFILRQHVAFQFGFLFRGLRTFQACHIFGEIKQHMAVTAESLP